MFLLITLLMRSIDSAFFNTWLNWVLTMHGFSFHAEGHPIRNYRMRCIKSNFLQSSLYRRKTEWRYAKQNPPSLIIHFLLNFFPLFCETQYTDPAWKSNDAKILQEWKSGQVQRALECRRTWLQSWLGDSSAMDTQMFSLHYIRNKQSLQEDRKWDSLVSKYFCIQCLLPFH